MSFAYDRKSPFLVWLGVCFLFLVATDLTFAQPHALNKPNEYCQLPSDLSNIRPDPEGTPTTVLVGLYVIDITKINDVEQTFSIDYYLSLQWKDPRLMNGGAPHLHDSCRVALDTVWNPLTQMLHQHNLVKQYDDIVEIRSEGMVTYQQRFVGELSLPVHLKEFPFDEHVLPITIASFRYGPDELQFIENKKETGMSDILSIPDWIIQSSKSRVSTVYFKPGDQHLARFDYEVQVKRRSGFFIWKVVIPLTMIVFMSWLVFWIDPSLLIPQVSISATAMLTLVAFQFTLANLLPRVSYLTRMDQYVLGCSILVFLALVEAVVSCTIAGRGNHTLAEKFDRWSRWSFPSVFVGLIIVCFLV